MWPPGATIFRQIVARALSRARSIRASRFVSISPRKEFYSPARRELITRLEDYGDGVRGAKAIGSEGRSGEAAARSQAGLRSRRESKRFGCPGCRETRIVLHNFRLVSRPEELQLLKLLHPPARNFADCLSRHSLASAYAAGAFRGVVRILLKENSVPARILKGSLALLLERRR